MNAEQNITVLKVALPEPLTAFVASRVAQCGYTSASESICALIRAAQKQLAREEQLLLQGLDSGPARGQLRSPGMRREQTSRSVTAKA